MGGEYSLHSGQTCFYQRIYLQEIEGTLHCVMAIQEAVPLEDNPHLRRLFGPDILGKLPTSGNDRVRRTALVLIGAFINSLNYPFNPFNRTKSD